MVNKRMKLRKDSFESVCGMAISDFTYSIKGNNYFKLHHRIMALDQDLALVMLDMFAKINKNSMTFVQNVADTC